MKRLALLIACLGFVWTAVDAAASSQPAKTLKVAVLTGGHSFEEDVFPKLFEPNKDLDVSILPQKDDSEIFEDVSAWPYDAIVMYNMSQRISEKRRANLLALLDKGVGLIVLHHAVAAYQEWPEFQTMLGCHYYIEDREINGVKHPKGTYQHDMDLLVHVADPSHPITAGLKDFPLHDETYATYDFDPDVHALITTDHPQSAKILGHVKTYRNARICYLQPGHGPQTFVDANFQQLLAQAIRWVAQGAPGLKADFKDLSAFQEPVGEWLVAEKVTLDPQDEKKLAWTAGSGIAVNGINGRTKHLVSKAEFGDVQLHIEFLVPKGSNSGVYLQGRYEIQVFDSWGVEHPKYSDCGGIYQRWHEEKGLKEEERGYEGRAPKVNASRKPGEWQSFDIIFRAPRFDANGHKTASAQFVSVIHNGMLIHENEDVSGPTRAALFEDEKPAGPLMLQGDHGPVAYRNLYIRPIDAETYGASGEAEADAYAQLAAYDFGQSRAALVAVEREIESVDPARFPAIEDRLLAVLQEAKTSFAAKEFVCKMLQRVGSEKAVPALAPMLLNETLSHIARLGLERIPGAAVDAALLKSLDPAPDKLKVGIINSLGERRKPEYVSALAPALGAADEAVAEAAAAALGKIGGEAAISALAKSRTAGSAAVREAATRAYLACASTLLEQGQSAAAGKIFDEVFAGKEIAPIRAAAFNGRVRARGEAGAPLLAEAIQGDAPECFSMALRLVRELPGTELTKQCAALLPALDGEKKALLLAALADRGDKAALPAVLEAVKDPAEDVREAVCNALGLIGDASAVPMLLGAAAGGGKESAAARESLARIRGDGVNDALISAMQGGDAAVKKEAIQALAARQAAEAAPILMGLAQGADAALRADALSALGTLAGAEQLAGLVDLLVKQPEPSDRAAIESAIVGAAQRVKDDAQRTAALLAALPKQSEAASRCAIVAVLGKVGDNASLEAVRGALKDPQQEVCDAAARALANWPSAAARNDLFALARDGKTETQRVLALRGYVRLLGTEPGRPAGELARDYGEALKLAKQPEGKRLVLAGLGNVKSPAALDLALPLLGDREVQAEAALAVLKTAETLGAEQPEAVKNALNKVLETCKDEKAVAQAQALLSKLRVQAMLSLNIAGQGQASSPDDVEKDGGSGGDAAAIDGNPETYWDETDGRPLYRLVVTFPEAKDIAALSIMGYKHQDFAPRDFEVLCDGAAVKSVKDAAYSENLFVAEFPAQHCKVVELKITGAYGNSPGIREFGLYPALPATPEGSK